jgi:hypothetical protein
MNITRFVGDAMTFKFGLACRRAIWSGGTLLTIMTSPASSAAIRVPFSGMKRNRIRANVDFFPQKFGFASITTCWPGLYSTNFWSPVPTGLVGKRSPSSRNAFGESAMAEVTLRRSGRFGRSVTRSIVYGSGSRYSRITPMRVFHGERDVGAAYCSSESFTDSAVKSSPLWNLTPLRRCHLSTVGDTCSHFVTSAGRGFSRSSRKTNASNMCMKMDQPGTPASTRGSMCPGSSDIPTTSSGAVAAWTTGLRNPMAAVAAAAAPSLST